MDVMNPYNPCIGCDYYNKPYWSVVSPCASCPRHYNTGGYVSTTTTNLPTAKEYREATSKTVFQFNARWSEPKYQCPKCGGGMCRNEMITLTSNPPQYEYQCDQCGRIEYQFM